MNAAALLMRHAARWMLVVLFLGAWLRSAFVWIYTPRPFAWGDLIHAHSHTAYFGWAALALMGLILWVLPGLTGREPAAPRALRWLLGLAPFAVLGSLVSFSLWGYGPASIAFSTLNEVLWFLFAYVFWQSVRQTPIRQWPPALWLIGVAVALLLLSTLGTVAVILTRVIFAVADPVLSAFGVYFFLAVFGDGWLEAGVMGVAVALLGGVASRRLAAMQAWLMLLLVGPASLRLLAPFGLEGLPLAVGALAGVGLAAAQLLFLVNIAGRRRAMAPPARPWWYLAAGALAVKAVLELVPLLPGWVGLAGERNLVIAFLHLKLLLIVSAGLIGALAMVGRVGRGWQLFASSSLLMVSALAVHGFAVSTHPLWSRPLYLLAFATGLTAALAAAWALWPVAGRDWPLSRTPAGPWGSGRAVGRVEA